MKNFTLYISYLILISCVLQLSLFAQEHPTMEDLFEMSLEELMNVEVITASKKLEEIHKAPATIYVITGQDIINNGYYTLIEALENVPGVVPINLDFFAFGGQRGFLSNFSQTLILINGREMQNLFAAETFISLQFVTNNIKQIEIIQGPGSALYGANALVGVINIITKNKFHDYNGCEYHLEMGSEATKGHNLIFGRNIKDFRLSGSIRIFESDMWNFTDFVKDTINFMEGYPQTALVPNLEYNNHSGVHNISLQLDYKNFYIGTESFFLKNGKGLENVALDYSAQFDVRDFNLYYLGWNKKINNNLDFNLEFQYYNEKFYGRNYTFNQSVFDTLVSEGRDPNKPLEGEEIYDNFLDIYSQEASSGSKRYRVNFQINYFLREDLSIVGGYVFDQFDLMGIALSSFYQIPPFDETRSENNRMRQPFFRQYKNSLFLQIQKQFFNNSLYLTIGGRLDYHEFYKEVFSARSGIVYNPYKNTTFKFLFGQAFREPNIFEQGAHVEVINKDIKPAKINTLELSAAHSITSNLKTNIVFYKSFAENFIKPFGTYYFYNSNEKIIVSGLECQVFFKMGKLNGDAGYAYVNPGEDKYAGEKTTALGVYQHRVNTGLTYKFSEHFFLNTRINFYDEIKAKHGNPAIEKVITIPSYKKVNVTVSSQNIKYSSLNMTLLFTVKNLFNSEFYQPNVRTGGPKQFLQPGRQIIGKIIFRLND